jgi:dipeptidyl aminopeptidase/acylaminoacyl peptidase
LSWETPDGLTGRGLLYLPEDATAAQPVPLIVTASPGDEESVTVLRRRVGPAFYREDLDQRLRDGFAVLYADVPLSDLGVYQQPMKQMVDGVNVATDAAVATGWIDAKRLGIVGVLEGAFMVNAVVTQTDRFKAAVSVNGGIDLITRFLGPPVVDPLTIEAGPGRMEQAYWDDPRRYVENSPLTYWNRVHTPLLLIHGGYAPPSLYVDEAFNGLKHLNRTALLARYPRMLDYPNAAAQRRITAWFKEHLLEGEATAQWADEGNAFGGGGLPGDVLVKPLPKPVKPEEPTPRDSSELPIYRGRPKQIEN